MSSAVVFQLVEDGGVAFELIDPETSEVEFSIDAETSTFSFALAEATPGPRGLPGSSQSYLVTDVSSWSQAHGLDYAPMVRLVQNDELVLISAEYPDAQHVYVEFPTPFTGTIILS